MAFTDLSIELQNIIMVNFEFFAKLLIIGVFFFLSVYYIFVLHKKLKTPYMLVSIIKVIAYVTSCIYLMFSPTYILLLYPHISLELILVLLFYAMLVVFLFAFVYFLLLLFYYSPVYLLKKVGLDVSQKGDNKVFLKIDRIIGYKK